jgi:hypothetical protein
MIGSSTGGAYPCRLMGRAAAGRGCVRRNGCHSRLQELAERMAGGRKVALGCQCIGGVGPPGARRARHLVDGLSDREASHSGTGD